MAATSIIVYIYDNNGSLITYTSGYHTTNNTIGNVLSDTSVISAGITELSATIGGEMLSHDSVVSNVLSIDEEHSSGETNYKAYKYEEPEPQAETITGFYLDGTEYKFEGGGAEYTAGNGIKITNDEIGLDGTYEKLDYSAMQGSAPEGFHIPLTTEWQGLKTIMNGLGLTTGNNWRINLHMPFAGRRAYNNAVIEVQGSNGLYWSSSPGASRPYNASNLVLSSSSVYADSVSLRNYGYSVRCFKDLYVAPTSSWTVVQGTLGSAGIFWNQTEGLISITDGTTGYTIMDKNLGATTVYNDGDTLSEANCGKYYQWGNNYGFAGTGSVTTSSTHVNASTYGPGNYYSSSTFITLGEDWSSVHNDNLRGGVTGVQIVPGNLVIGDKDYKIVTSATAPASGTASNIITIVTD